MIHSFSPLATAVGAGIWKAIVPARSSTRQISQVGLEPKQGALSVLRIRTWAESRRVQNSRPNISPAALSPASVSLRYRLNILSHACLCFATRSRGYVYPISPTFNGDCLATGFSDGADDGLFRQEIASAIMPIASTMPTPILMAFGVIMRLAALFVLHSPWGLGIPCPSHSLLGFCGWQNHKNRKLCERPDLRTQFYYRGKCAYK